MKKILPLILLTLSLGLSAQSVLPGYSGFWQGNREVSLRELVGYSTSELGFLRNEIFAKYGRTFRTAKYQQHFDQQSWYVRKPEFQDSWLNPTDYLNINIILSVERPAVAPADVVAKLLDEVEYSIPSGPYTNDTILFLSRNRATYQETIWNPYFNDVTEIQYNYIILGDFLLLWDPENGQCRMYPHNNGEYLDWERAQYFTLTAQQLIKLKSSTANG
jgi:hypothetical protein